MGHFLNLSDSQQANGFLEEAGRTLESAIKGILLLEQDRIRVNKQLQPVEDNPLRLGLDYVGTVDALFGDQKSQVHLSPSAAVTECLSFLRLHAYASRQAVGEALACVIDTFSPDVLMARFQRYRRDHLVDINDPAWIWEMYNHYFEELKSTRQQGVDRLFQEVFEQVYDKALRDLRDEDKA
jgi:type VI secretion system protein ImpI